MVLGLSSSTQSVEFVNSDDEPVTLGQARVIGPGAAAFAVADSSCDGKELVPHQATFARFTSARSAWSWELRFRQAI